MVEYVNRTFATLRSKVLKGGKNGGSASNLNYGNNSNCGDSSTRRNYNINLNLNLQRADSNNSNNSNLNYAPPRIQESPMPPAESPHPAAALSEPDIRVPLRLNSKQNLGTFSIFVRSVWSGWALVILNI